MKYLKPLCTTYFSPYLFKVEVIGNIWENRDLLGLNDGPTKLYLFIICSSLDPWYDMGWCDCV